MMRYVLNITLLLCLTVVMADQACGAVPPSEKNALLALYYSTGGPSDWTRKDFWNFEDPCVDNWWGVTCDGSNTHVIGLNLFQNGLTGTIPDDLANLTELRDLSLSYNNLSGGIPIVLSSLSQLQTLILSGNALTGTVPSQLGLLSQLTNLSLHGNQLEGPIPQELGKLTNLVHLSLMINKLSGRIPKELGMLTNLNTLYLEDNLLCGEIPLSLMNLVNLLDSNGLDIDMNYLHTNDPALDAFLVQKGGDWKSSQGTIYCPSDFPWPMFLPAVTNNTQSSM